MPTNQLLNEFAQINPDDLKLRIVEKFDELFDETDELVTLELKAEFELILQEKINALDQA